MNELDRRTLLAGAAGLLGASTIAALAGAAPATAAGGPAVAAHALLLAITPDDSALHVGAAGPMTTHLRTSTTTPPAEIPVLDFFLPSGEPVTLTATSGGWLFVKDVSRPAVTERSLLDRVDAALAHMQTVLDQQGGGPAAVPRPKGTLPEVLAALAVEFDLAGAQPNTRGNWLHMLAHAAGVAH